MSGGSEEHHARKEQLGAVLDGLLAQPEPPPECQTEAEKKAFAFGWWKAMEAQRLASKPVAWLHTPPQTDEFKCPLCYDDIANIKNPSQPEQEPVAWLWELTGEVTTDPDKADGMWLPLYTTPPQRTWVGLTDEEQKTIADLASANDWHDFDVMDTTEAKLKEKNK